MSQLIETYQSVEGKALDGAPNPDSGLVNSAKDVKFHVKPSTTYYIRIICPGNYIGHGFYIDGHGYTTVALDGTYVEPVYLAQTDYTNLSRLATGQRMDILLTTKNETSTNYGMIDFMDMNMLFFNKGVVAADLPAGYDANVTAWLVYNDNASLPPQPELPADVGNANFYDDLLYHPLNQSDTLGSILEPVDRQIVIDTSATNITNISR